MPGAAAGSETPPYANAIDTSAYVLHLVDDYGNPVYNWNLSNFGLTSTATGIFLDEVSHTGPSALYINAGNGNYTSIPQDVKTDGNGNLFFHIQSYAPGKYTEKFSLEYKLWDRDRNPI